MQTSYLFEDATTEPPMRRPVPVLAKRPERPRPAVNAATAVPVAKPRRAFEDLPWRAGWRVRRFVLTIWGPPQLDDAHDPLAQLVREREQRYAGGRTAPAGA